MEYALHRSFPNPVRTVCERANGVELVTAGWGVFRIKVRVLFEDGSGKVLSHDLVFDETLAQALTVSALRTPRE